VLSGEGGRDGGRRENSTKRVERWRATAEPKKRWTGRGQKRKGGENFVNCNYARRGRIQLTMGNRGSGRRLRGADQEKDRTYLCMSSAVPKQVEAQKPLVREGAPSSPRLSTTQREPIGENEKVEEQLVLSFGNGGELKGRLTVSRREVGSMRNGETR